MGQLERYGLYVLCLVIFLILGVAIWGENPQVAHAARMQKNDRLENAGSAQPAVSQGNRGSGPSRAGVLSPGRLLQLADRPPAAPASEVKPVGDAGDSVRSAPVPAEGSEPGKAVTYTVKPGEVLGTILKRHYGKAIKYQQMVVDANPGLNPNRLGRGQKLVLPAIPGTGKAPSAPQGSSAATPKGTRKYTVRDGENPSTIAKRELKDEKRYLEIVKLNPDMNANRLSPGDVILIPDER